MTAAVLIIPGLGGSGPDHWQTLWRQRRTDCELVDQADWADPDSDAWAERLEAVVRHAPERVVLVAHSLGCALVGKWADSGGMVARVGGALLVAPCDTEVDRACAAIRRFAPMPKSALPFRSTVVASDNDPFATLDRARGFAHDWGSAFVNAGSLGHINAASGLGDWLFGQVLLDTLLASADADPAPYVRAAALGRSQQRLDQIAYVGAKRHDNGLNHLC